MTGREGNPAGGGTYEERDVGFAGAMRFAATFIAVTLVLVGALSLVAAGAWQPFAERTYGRPAAAPAEGPRLQEDPSSDLAALRREAAARLGSYGWIDRERGIARIPVDEAMKLQAERARSGDRP